MSEHLTASATDRLVPMTQAEWDRILPDHYSAGEEQEAYEEIRASLWWQYTLRACSIDVMLGPIQRRVNALQQRISAHILKQEQSRKRSRRQHRAAFRRRKRGLA